MSETPKPYGDPQPVIPSDRVTEDAWARAVYEDRLRENSERIAAERAAAPSGRITEHKLLEIEYTAPINVASKDPVDSGNGQLALDLVYEIRRYRALLLGLAQTKNGECPRKLSGECRWCDQRDGAWAARLMGREPTEHDIVEPHTDDCPWPALEAEVKAIRSERKQP